MQFTYQDYLNLPEDRHYELIEGDLLMSPSPSEKHQRVVARLIFLFESYLEKSPLGRIYPAPFDVVISDTDVVQPDVFFVSTERASRLGEKAMKGAPDLVIEVLSPATAARDRTVKAKLYARAGVRELWLLDPDAKTLEVLVPTESGFGRPAVFTPGQIGRSPLLPDLAIDVAKLFG